MRRDTLKSAVILILICIRIFFSPPKLFVSICKNVLTGAKN